MKLRIILEKDGNEFWGRINDIPEFFPSTLGSSVQEVTQNITGLIKSYLQQEGKDNAFFTGVDADSIEYGYAYDLQAFFEEYQAIKISSIAKQADMNPALVRHYAAGIKHASEAQVRKIEEAVHQLGRKLIEVHLV